MGLAMAAPPVPARRHRALWSSRRSSSARGGARSPLRKALDEFEPLATNPESMPTIASASAALMPGAARDAVLRLLEGGEPLAHGALQPSRERTFAAASILSSVLPSVDAGSWSPADVREHAARRERVRERRDVAQGAIGLVALPSTRPPSRPPRGLLGYQDCPPTCCTEDGPGDAAAARRRGRCRGR